MWRTLEPVINFRVACAGSQFFRVQGARSDGCRVHPSEARRRNRENWPQPFEFHPCDKDLSQGTPGLRRKSADTSLSSSPWNRQCLRPPPRLSRFSRATQAAGKLITGSRARVDSLSDRVNSTSHRRLRVAAIRFLNPAPLMWDFEHPPLNAELAERYEVNWMLPSECADRIGCRCCRYRPCSHCIAGYDAGTANFAGLHHRLQGPSTLTAAGAARRSATRESAQRRRGHGEPHDIGVRAHSFPQVGQRRSTLHSHGR